MEIASLAFIMTDRCNASCKMCCYSCTPHGNQLLDTARMKQYMDQAKGIETIKSIAFSGGEAIMHYDQFLDCVSYAANLGFQTTLVTNGFWAANEEKGYAMMQELAQAGLSQVSVSIDKFHQEFVPIETERKAVRILHKLGLLSALTFMDTQDGTCVGDSLESLRPEIYSAGEMILYPLFEAGAAREHVTQDQYLRLCEAQNARCPYSNDIVVLFDGTLMMCCAQYSHEIPMTHLGNFHENTLQEAIETFHQNDFIYLLLSRGFSWYIEKAKELGYECRTHYGVSCELCHELFTNAALVEGLKPLVAQEAGRIRLAKLLGKTI